jgi:23S rRNA pseudouridine1911/1915/1917 synthase
MSHDPTRRSEGPVKRIRVINITVPPEGEGLRLDVLICRIRPELSRAQVKRLVDSGWVTVGGVHRKASFPLKTGQEIVVELPEPEPSQLRPEAIPLDIVYEDGYLLLVNKPAGMTVHPAAGAREGTLVHALLHHCKDLSGIGGVLRPGIVHRLDKGTSGLLVVAKTDEAHRSLAEQIRTRALKRVYRAIVWGGLERDSGTVDAPVGRHSTVRQKMAVVPVGGKEAVTHYKVLRRYSIVSFVEVTLETGRTHQVRTHMAHLGHPVFGDPQYGGRRKAVNAVGGRLGREGSALLKGIDRQALHAWRLSLKHPIRGDRMDFTAPLPEDMTWVLDRLDEDMG